MSNTVEIQTRTSEIRGDVSAEKIEDIFATIPDVTTEIGFSAGQEGSIRRWGNPTVRVTRNLHDRSSTVWTGQFSLYVERLISESAAEEIVRSLAADIARDGWNDDWKVLGASALAAVQVFVFDELHRSLRAGDGPVDGVDVWSTGPAGDFVKAKAAENAEFDAQLAEADRLLDARKDAEFDAPDWEDYGF